jgi:hypothetical protein
MTPLLQDIQQARVIKFKYTKPLKTGETETTDRVIWLGADVLMPLLSGGESWGESNKNGKIVTHSGKEYIQGVEENEEGKPFIKRFDLSKVSDLEVIS